MMPEDVIQKLQGLELDPLLLGPLIEQIREVTRPSKPKLALIEESLTVNRLQRARNGVGDCRRRPSGCGGGR